jgi:hypothetical protein
MVHASSKFLYAVSNLYDAEGRIVGTMPASALRHHASTINDTQEWPNSFERPVRHAFSFKENHLVQLAKLALLFMRWAEWILGVPVFLRIL